MRRRHLLLLVTAAVVVVTALLANARTPFAVERRLGQWIHDLPAALTGPLEAVMQAGTLTAILVVGAVLVIAGRHRAAGAAALAGAAGWSAASVLKGWIDRPRPTLATLGRAPRELVDNAAWPSSHATIAAALATVLVVTLARGRLGRGVVVAVAALTGIARVHLSVHWGLDVVGGAALGTTAGLLAILVVKP